MPRQHHYQASLVWSGATQGTTDSYQSYSREFTAQIDGKPTLIGSADPTFRGDPSRHNPEDLLLIALSACHMLSYLALCPRRGIRVLAYTDEATATMEMSDGKIRFTEAVLYPRVVIAPGDAAGEDRNALAAKAMALHAPAHAECFIASSVAFPVRNMPTILFADDPAVHDSWEAAEGEGQPPQAG
ncbi:MAG: OsmC family protein [Armatimonadota bacterium]